MQVAKTKKLQKCFSYTLRRSWINDLNANFDDNNDFLFIYFETYFLSRSPLEIECLSEYGKLCGPR